jgi:putative tryptophan/tyrosine transport system substrate-binding protein
MRLLQRCAVLPAHLRLVERGHRWSSSSHEGDPERLDILKASSEDDLEAAFTTMIQQRVDVLVVTPDAFFFARRGRLVALAARRAMPAIYPVRWFPEVGGLMCYGPATTDLIRQAGTYAGKLLKGAKPADLLSSRAPRSSW